MEPITVAQLRGLQRERRERDLRRTVEHITTFFVIPAAEAGDTRVFVTENKYPHMLPVKYPPTFALLLEALQSKFPDASVTAGSTTSLCDNEVVEKKTHIIIDWSQTEVMNSHCK
jgi:hypothetical protein